MRNSDKIKEGVLAGVVLLFTLFPLVGGASKWVVVAAALGLFIHSFMLSKKK